MEWPGFSYDEPEWERLRQLATLVPYPAYVNFCLVNAAVFIAFACIGIAAVFLPLAIILFPIPAETSTLKFAMLLAGCCFLIIGCCLPVSLRIAAALVSTDAMRRELSEAPGDAALARKIAWQINRITLVMCGLLVPGILVFVAYDIQAGPLIAALKWVAIGLMVVSTIAGVRRQRRS